MSHPLGQTKCTHPSSAREIVLLVRIAPGGMLDFKENQSSKSQGAVARLVGPPDD